jgi:hypothetical protein
MLPGGGVSEGLFHKQIVDKLWGQFRLECYDRKGSVVTYVNVQLPTFTSHIKIRERDRTFTTFLSHFSDFDPFGEKNVPSRSRILQHWTRLRRSALVDWTPSLPAPGAPCRIAPPFSTSLHPAQKFGLLKSYPPQTRFV